MKRNILPRLGVEVSEIGLGCEHLQGQPYGAIKDVVGAALDCGVNILDVFMSEPDVRSNIGKALGSMREQVVLQGHIGAAWLDGQYKRTRDIGHCRFFFEDFLKRLNTDYVDIGMLHYIDEDKDFDRVFTGPLIEYALELKSRGAVRAVGISSHNPKVALRAVRTGLVDAILFSLNPAYDLLPADENIDVLFEHNTYRDETLLNTDPSRSGLYRACEAAGVAITVMKALGAGTLLDKRSSPLNVAMTPCQLIHYALTRPAVKSVLVGARRPEEVYTAVSYEDAPDSEKDYSLILSASDRYSADGKCMYCNHCLPCPARIDIAMVNKLLDLTEIDGGADTVRQHYAALERSAQDCVSCGSCERNCPFGVEVIQKMARAKEVFGR